METARNYLDELSELSNERSSDARRKMLNRITDLFLATTDRQKESDRAEFGEQIETLAYSLDAEARVDLSKRLSTEELAPHNLALRLATDEIIVASPMLEHSSVLTDDDLVGIASTSSSEHLLAITNRKTLSVPVTDVIVGRGTDQVLENVTKNEGAAFSDKSFSTLSQRSETNIEIRANLVHRTDVPEQVFAKLKERIAQEVAEQEGDEPATPGKANTKSRQKQTEELLAKFEKLREEGALKQSMLVDAARARNLPEVIAILTAMSGLDRTIVQNCMTESDLAALAVLCRASQLEEKTYGALLQLRLHLDGTPAIEAVAQMKKYQDLSIASAERVLRFLKVRLAATTSD